jgi:hypothetical protein
MGFVGTNISDRNDAQVCSRQGKRRSLKGYNPREIHVFIDEDDTSDEELPAKVKYAVIVQEEAFIPDDDFFSEQKSK